MSVSRGLITTETRSLRALRPSDPQDAAARAYITLVDAPAGHYAWRERRDWASRLGRGDSDQFGRRLFSDAGRSDARFIARVSRRALRGLLPANKIQWGHVRQSLIRVHRELAGVA